jgi:hypothetical protein
MVKKKNKERITDKLRHARLDVLRRNEQDKEEFANVVERNKYIERKYLEAALVTPTVISLKIIPLELEDSPEEINANETKFSSDGLAHDDLLFPLYPLQQITEEKAKKIIGLLLWDPHLNNPSEYENKLLLGINLNRPKEDILAEIQRILKFHHRRKTTRFTWLKKWLQYKQVWDARRMRKKFSVIADELNLKKDATRRMFYRAFEIIYGKKYNPSDYEKPQIRKKYLKRVCETCSEKEICSDLCPDVIDYVNQDSKAYQREHTGYDTL